MVTTFDITRALVLLTVDLALLGFLLYLPIEHRRYWRRQAAERAAFWARIHQERAEFWDQQRAEQAAFWDQVRADAEARHLQEMDRLSR